MTSRELILERGKFEGSYFFYVPGQGYYYHFHRYDDESNTMYFTCKHTYCSGRAMLKIGSEFQPTQRHSHAPNFTYAEFHSARASVMNEARSSMTYRPFSEILRTSRRQIPNQSVRAELTLRRLRSAMQRARGSVFPRNPDTLLGLCRILEDPIWESLTQTVDLQDSFYLGTAVGSDVSINIVFMSSRGLQLMREAQRLFADGTFTITPSVGGCYQVFTIITLCGHTVINLSWCLMQCKSQAAYEAVLALIRDHLVNWNFNSVICDFEDAMMNSFRNVFNVNVQGCFFHAADAMAKNAKSYIGIHLLRFYGETQIIVWLCCALPLLPSALLQAGLNAVGAAALGLGDFLYGIVRPFLAYMQHSWLEHPSRGPSMSVCGSVHRTNNGSESNNHRMNRTMGTPHPNVFHFVRTVAIIEDETNDDMESLRRGLIPTRHRRALAVANDSNIIRLTNDLMRDQNPSEQTLINFLFSASLVIQGTIYEALR